MRHGESDCQKALVDDHLRYGLNETGRSQAANVAREIRDLGIERVFSSPVPRAFETANIIFPEKKIEVVESLKECSSDVWLHIHQNISSEEKEEFKREIFKGLECIEELLFQERSLVVAHGGVFWGLAQYFDFEFYLLDNVQIVKVPLRICSSQTLPKPSDLRNIPTHCLIKKSPL